MQSSGQSQHWTSAKACLLKVCWWRTVCLLYPVLCLAALPNCGEAAKARCGRELVADLEFVCGDRGFYRGKVTASRNGARLRGKGIVEQCCLRGCDLQHLEAYCAKPRRSRRHTQTWPPRTLEEVFGAIFRQRILALYMSPKTRAPKRGEETPKLGPHEGDNQRLGGRPNPSQKFPEPHRSSSAVEK